MPDIKTALQTALEKVKDVAPKELPADWDDEGGAAKIEEVSTTNQKEQTMKHLFKPTNNVTRETFNYVRDNPGTTRQKAHDALVARGFNSKSVSSLFAQMSNQRLIFVDASGGLYAAVKQYSPIKSYKALARIKAAEAQQPRAAIKAKAKVQDSVALVSPTPAPAPAPASTWSANHVLNNLSVLQARAVYDELKKIFGA